MKQFIVFLAIFPFMMAFLLQFSLQQNTDYKIEEINSIVDAAKEEAMLCGQFTPENIEELKASLASVSGCEAEEVDVDVPADVKYRTGEFDEREMISYRIAVPLKDLMAMPGLFGIKKQSNQSLYILEEKFASERLM